MTESRKLLADYATNGSEPAFRELVSRYLNLVYSTAIRLVGGDTLLAQDVAQTVFVDLARKARTLPRDVMLGGWLHRHTCFVASKIVRGERRRQFRERQVVAMNEQQDYSEANLARVAPVLDEAINQLGAEDRTAILLRFRQVKQVGQDLVGLANAYSQSGDQASAQAALQLAMNIGQRYANAPANTPLISQLVGMAVERMVLSTMDPTSPYGSNGQTVQDRLNQIIQNRAAINGVVEQAQPLLPMMSDQDILIYENRRMAFGEVAALQWVVSKYGQQ